jgi:hypothetical protein
VRTPFAQSKDYFVQGILTPCLYLSESRFRGLMDLPDILRNGGFVELAAVSFKVWSWFLIHNLTLMKKIS